MSSRPNNSDCRIVDVVVICTLILSACFARINAVCLEGTCSNGRCFSNQTRCDGYDDCWDNTDETNCGCAVTTDFRCPDGVCISSLLRCDGNPDCSGNGTDEIDCYSTTTTAAATSTPITSRTSSTLSTSGSTKSTSTISTAAAAAAGTTSPTSTQATVTPVMPIAAASSTASTTTSPSPSPSSSPVAAMLMTSTMLRAMMTPSTVTDVAATTAERNSTSSFGGDQSSVDGFSSSSSSRTTSMSTTDIIGLVVGLGGGAVVVVAIILLLVFCCRRCGNKERDKAKLAKENSSISNGTTTGSDCTNSDVPQQDVVAAQYHEYDTISQAPRDTNNGLTNSEPTDISVNNTVVQDTFTNPCYEPSAITGHEYLTLTGNLTTENNDNPPPDKNAVYIQLSQHDKERPILPSVYEQLPKPSPDNVDNNDHMRLSNE